MCCAEQANAQLDALGDHQTLLNEHNQADAQYRKLSREQVIDPSHQLLTHQSTCC